MPTSPPIRIEVVTAFLKEQSAPEDGRYAFSPGDIGGVLECVRDKCKRIRDVRQGPDGYLYILTDEGAPNGRVVRVKA